MSSPRRTAPRRTRDTAGPVHDGLTIAALRRFAVGRSLFPPVSLPAALDALGFVQADPIRAPARAQDLTLRHRVAGYRAGDLEQAYPDLDIFEDFFVNYGFVTRGVHALMHPRGGPAPWTAARGRHVPALLEFVRTRGTVHPREVSDHFAHGSVTNYWGGSSSATTHLLDAMHYRGLLRVARREAGIRLYAVHATADRVADANTRLARLDALVDVVVRKYAPLPAASLAALVRRLRFGVPHWSGELGRALDRARHRLARARVDGVDWYWPADESPLIDEQAGSVRLLAPFDPVVWDRRRFELLWTWPYRFEAYTPVPKRQYRLLRAAAPVAGRGGGLGQPRRPARTPAADGRLRVRRGTPRARVPSSAGRGSPPHRAVPRSSRLIPTAPARSSHHARARSPPRHRLKAELCLPSVPSDRPRSVRRGSRLRIPHHGVRIATSAGSRRAFPGDRGARTRFRGEFL